MKKLKKNEKCESIKILTNWIKTNEKLKERIWYEIVKKKYKLMKKWKRI